MLLRLNPHWVFTNPNAPFLLEIRSFPQDFILEIICKSIINHGSVSWQKGAHIDEDAGKPHEFSILESGDVTLSSLRPSPTRSFRSCSLQGRLHTLPLRLASFHAYPSIAVLPRQLQGLIRSPWLAVTPAGFFPACSYGLARPQLRADPNPPRSLDISRHFTKVSNELFILFHIELG